MSESGFIALGGNIGDRWANLAEAVRQIDALSGTRVEAISEVWETAPVGKTDQPAFLNAAVRVETCLEPLPLLESLQGIETRMGRIRTERWGPRVIDLDLILMGNRTMKTERLTLPHPRMRERLFVLIPLLDLEDSLTDPETGERLSDIAAGIDEGNWGERRGPLGL